MAGRQQSIERRSKRAVGSEKKNKKAMVTQEILNIIDEKREAKQQKLRHPTEENLNNYRRLCREVDRKCKNAKKAWIEAKCESCERSYRQGRSKELYSTVREVTK